MTEESAPNRFNPIRQISLTKLTTVKAVVDSVNETYGESIDAELYEDRLAFVDLDGLLTLFCVRLDNGAVEWVFKDRYSIERQDQENLDNPKAFFFPDTVDNFSIKLNTECELEFLKGIKIDVRYDSGKVGAGASTKLANLLNRYNVGDGWGSNPHDSNTTAYFVLRYFGSGNDAPDVYNFNRDTKLLVVVELMKHGVYKTHALMVG